MANQKNNTIDTIDTGWWTNNGKVPTSVITSHNNTMASNITTMGNADTLTIGSTYLNSMAITGPVPDWSGLNATSPMTVTAAGKIELRGESADIMIDGVSLKATLETLQERLNWMRPSTELEAEWDQLRELGDRYRELEQQCKEKSQMWTKLQTVSKTTQA